MGLRKLFVLFAALGLLITGCGVSNTSDDDADPLQNEDEEILQFCTRFPSSRQCEDINTEAEELGFFDYFGGGDDFFADSAFSNSGLGCGCRNGERPVFYRGVRRCEPLEIYEQVRREQIYMRFVKRPDGEKKLWVAFNTITSSQPASGFPDDNFGASCHSDFGSRCRVERGLTDCQGLFDRQGTPVDARCVPVDGTQYGYCDDAL